jgi:hypothetical protein
MIAFKDDFNSDEPLDSIKKLSKILNQIYLDDDIDEYSMVNENFEDINLSELLELVYYNLFTKDYEYMNISIKKNKNNSLTLKIENLK